MVWTAGKSMCSELARELASSKEDIPIQGNQYQHRVRPLSAEAGHLG